MSVWALLRRAVATHTSQLAYLFPPSRLIMSTHRDLEAFKRLSYRKGKPAGKAPVPYASKGAGNLPR